MGKIGFLIGAMFGYTFCVIFMCRGMSRAKEMDRTLIRALHEQNESFQDN